MISFSIAVYISEFFLENMQDRNDPVVANAILDQSRHEKAVQLGVDFDSRSKFEVVQQLTQEGFDAYPNYFPFLARDLGGLPSDEGRIYPLSGLSKTLTVYCNEGGFWSTFVSDEHGFNNPENLYQKDLIDAVLVGDSYVEGACVEQDQTIAAHLRSQGVSALSFGKGSNGPLTQLATLKEYGVQLHPKVVFWFYATNDLSDLRKEQNVEFLRNYLSEPTYSQKLYFRQTDIDRAVKRFVGSEMEKQAVSNIVKQKVAQKRSVEQRERVATFHSSSLIRMLKLYNLRLLLGLTPNSASSQSEVSKLTKGVQLFSEVLFAAKEYTSNWGGTLVFVYLAPYERYSTLSSHSEKEEILSVVERLAIPLVDSHEVSFSRQADPKAMFPLGLNGHYNGTGYKVLAEALARHYQQLDSE